MDAFAVFLCLLVLSPASRLSAAYEPSWDSLDQRPLPTWYDDAKIGVFIHWGVFSVPSFGSEWFWFDWKKANRTEYVDFMERNFPPNHSYQDFAKDFRAELFDPNKWAAVLAKSGAKYVVLTTKHHEGYTMWPSRYSFSWNAQDVGPHRDIVGDLAMAIRTSTKLRFGVYHSLYEWFNPLYLADKAAKFTTHEFVDNKIIPEMKELVNKYRPEVLWSDGDWETDSKYWRSPEFLAWLYNDSPVKKTIVVNDRWGNDTACKHGDFVNCQDRYLPDKPPSKKWENAMTIDRKSWGFRREATLADFFSAEDLLEQLAKTVSLGGNFLMNIGPTKDGTIPPIYEERLEQLGRWLSLNGESIYRTQPWHTHNDSTADAVYYTQARDKPTLYAIVLHWPEGNILMLDKLIVSKVTLIGYGDLKVEITKKTVIHLPNKALLSSCLGWVIKMQVLGTSVK